MRKKRKKAPMLITLVCLNLLIFTAGFFTYKFLFDSEETHEIQQNKTMSVVPTDYFVSKAVIWLTDIGGYEPSYEELREKFSSLSVTLNYQVPSTEGEAAFSISEESYLACENSAYEILGGIFKEILVKQGHYEEHSEEEIDKALEQLLGMSLAEYLRQCDIGLMPTREEIFQMANILSNKEGLNDSNKVQEEGSKQDKEGIQHE